MKNMIINRNLLLENVVNDLHVVVFQVQHDVF
jgi:hypothetical protein